jgi:hypothetical protein
MIHQGIGHPYADASLLRVGRRRNMWNAARLEGGARKCYFNLVRSIDAIMRFSSSTQMGEGRLFSWRLWCAIHSFISAAIANVCEAIST